MSEDQVDGLFRRVFESLVNSFGRSGKQGTDLFRVVTNSQHIIEVSSGENDRACRADVLQEQEPGAQQEPAAFVARMKALTNLPSTSFASASTSRPWPERKARASSTL